MTTDKKLVSEKLKRWNKYLNEYCLPDWESIPNIGLYMEQVIMLLKQYLDYLPPELKEAQFITSSTINNYVRMKVIPGPEKKQYYRLHIAYLIMVLTMKPGIEISLIQKLIPSDLGEEEFRLVYEEYATLHRRACAAFAAEVRYMAAPLLEHEPTDSLNIDKPEQLVELSAIMSGFTHLLSEKLLLLE